MANFNQVILIGNLTRDPEVRQTPTGVSVASATLAVNENIRAADGTDRTETCFLDLEIWGKQAEILQQYCHKGSPLFVEGRLRQDSWQDRETGATRTKIRVRVERFQMLGQRGGNVAENGGEQPAQQPYQSNNNYSAPRQQQQSAPMPKAPSFNQTTKQPVAPSYGQSPRQTNNQPMPDVTFQDVDVPEDDIPF